LQGLSAPAYAAEGKYDQTSCYSGQSHVIQQGEGITAGSYELTGMMPGQEGTPLYMLSGRCLGQFSIINGDYSENGSCQFWNAAGDKMFGVYARKGDPAKAEGTWHVVQGTGKLEGITLEGKWTPIVLPLCRTSRANAITSGVHTPSSDYGPIICGLSRVTLVFVRRVPSRRPRSAAAGSVCWFQQSGRRVVVAVPVVPIQSTAPDLWTAPFLSGGPSVVA